MWGEEMVTDNTLELTKDQTKYKILFLGKFYLLKLWLNFWGVTNSTPLKENLVLEIG